MRRQIRATADPREDTIERAARALGVSPRWLRHGETDLDSAPPPPISDRYPSRAQLVALARARGVSDALLEALALDPYSAANDPGIAYWTERLGAIADADRALGDALGQRATAAHRTRLVREASARGAVVFACVLLAVALSVDNALRGRYMLSP